jgi:hypothetical protein
MRPTTDELTQNLAERLCWEVAHRDDMRVARRLYRKQEVDGVYRLDEGAVLDDFFRFLQVLGVLALLEEVHGTAIQRQMVPSVQYVFLHVRQGMCQRGAATRQGVRTPGPITPKVCIEDRQGRVHEIDRNPARSLGEVQAHSSWVNLMLELQHRGPEVPT